MLNEIICDKFNTKNQKISFHQGLNVVLGNDTGTNSIGKSKKNSTGSLRTSLKNPSQFSFVSKTDFE